MWNLVSKVLIELEDGDKWDNTYMGWFIRQYELMV